MEKEENTDELSLKDRELWRIAKKRVGFRKHLSTYIVINAMFWFIWYFSDENDHGHDFPWPVWPMLGWGIGLVFSYLDAYVFNKHDSIEKEYQKLKNR